MLLSMIKSSFCFYMSNDLWDQLMNMLAMVNSNPDVIDKWMVRNSIKIKYFIFNTFYLLRFSIKKVHWLEFYIFINVIKY
jgi:hypothetical protein